jgi:hypothetical protein
MFKVKAMQRLYDDCRRLGVDVTSEFYYGGVPRRGAAHRVAYWKGRAGEPRPKYIGRDSLSYAAFKAGRDERVQDARKGNLMPMWEVPVNYPVPPPNWRNQ